MTVADAIPLPPDGDLDPALLLASYRAGIFPMGESRFDPQVRWYAPTERGILPLDAFHLPRRLRRTILSGRFEIGSDLDFSGVVAACAGPRREAADTWINTPIERAVGTLHRAGFAHSVECRRGGVLVGGLYGVALDRAFFGESMFSRETDASKVALVALVWHLRQQGFMLLDAQFLTDHLARFGAVEIAQDDYLRRLSEAVRDPTRRRFGRLDAAAVKAEIAHNPDAAL